MNMKKLAGFCDAICYWTIILIPFSVVMGLGLANAVVAIMASAFVLKKLLNREKILVIPSVYIAYVCLVVYMLLSFKNTLFPGNSIKAFLRWLVAYPAIFVVLADGVKDAKHVKRIVFSIALSISMVSIDAIWQMIFGRDLIWGNVIQSSPIGLARPTATFNGTNLLGIFLCALTPLILTLALFYYHGKERIWSLAAGCLGAIGVLLTLSRGAGLGVWLALLFVSIVRKKKALIAILIGLLLIYPFIMPKNIKAWAKEIGYNPVVFMFNYDRLSMHKNAVNMIKHHPVIGVGLNTFGNNYAMYKLPETGRDKTAASGTYAHNIYLHTAGETGLLGLGALLFFLFALFKQGINVFKSLKDEYLKTVAIALLGCIGAFLVNGMTETNLYFPTVVVVFWYLIGVSLSLVKFLENRSS